VLEIQLCAAEVLGATISGRNLSLAFDEGFRRHDSLSLSERAAVRQILYDGLRAYGLLREQLARLLVTPIRHPALSNLLYVALAQLQFSRAKPYAVVDHAVRAADKLGQPAARGLVNAVLRNFLRRRSELDAGHFESPEARYGFPAWWVERLRSEHPDAWEEMLACANRHPPMTLRVNRRRATVDDCLAAFAKEDIAAIRIGPAAIEIAPRPVHEIPGFDAGHLSVQDASAQFAAPLLDLAGGQRVLDACAAPGGKTCHALELADVELLALDSDPGRLAKVRENLDRLGLAAELRAADASLSETWWDGIPFDRILVDAPCSASGVVRRHPDIRWTRRQADLPGFAAQQSALLESVWKALGGGGKMLYVTCSVFRDENGATVEGFLARQRDARLIPAGLPGACGGQVLPDDHHDGFFYALFEKA
jgi:16S rRNA (cytosine967-C5)-methyltransferase